MVITSEVLKTFGSTIDKVGSCSNSQEELPHFSTIATTREMPIVVVAVGFDVEG